MGKRLADDDNTTLDLNNSQIVIEKAPNIHHHKVPGASTSQPFYEQSSLTGFNSKQQTMASWMPSGAEGTAISQPGEMTSGGIKTSSIHHSKANSVQQHQTKNGVSGEIAIHENLRAPSPAHSKGSPANSQNSRASSRRSGKIKPKINVHTKRITLDVGDCNYKGDFGKKTVIREQ